MDFTIVQLCRHISYIYLDKIFYNSQSKEWDLTGHSRDFNKWRAYGEYSTVNNRKNARCIRRLMKGKFTPF